MGKIVIEDDKLDFIKTIMEIKDTVNYIQDHLPIPETVDVEEVIRLLDISKSTAKRYPYLLPNNGVSEFPTGRKRWNYQTFLDWKKIPEDTRKKNYQKLIMSQAQSKRRK